MKIIKNLIRYCIWILSFFLSHIIPKKNNLYIFGSINWKTFSWNSKAMFLYYLKNDKSKEVYYMTRNKNLFSLKIPNLIYINSFKWYILFLRAKLIYTDCDLYDVNPWLSYQFWKFNVINLWHWDPIKAIWYLSKAKFSKWKEWLAKIIFKNYFQNVIKLWCASSDFFKNILNKWHITNKYKVTWLARNDIFFNKSLEFFNIKENLNLNKFNKVFLYVPTWRQDSTNLNPFSNEFLEKLNNFMKKFNYIFIIKSHQNSENILKIKYSNIIDISKNNIDSQELMKYSDLMITDYSSIFIDYMLLNKPILFYAYDYEKYKNNLVNLVDTYENCTIKEWICYNENELFELLKENNLFNNTYYKNNFYDLKNKYHKYQNWWYINNIVKIIENNK